MVLVYSPTRGKSGKIQKKRGFKQSINYENAHRSQFKYRNSLKIQKYCNMNKDSTKMRPQISNNETKSVACAHPQTSSYPQGQFCPVGDIWRISGDIFSCYNWGCYWHQVGRGQGCCQTPCNAWLSTPQQGVNWYKMSLVLCLRKLDKIKAVTNRDDVSRNDLDEIKKH